MVNIREDEKAREWFPKKQPTAVQIESFGENAGNFYTIDNLPDLVDKFDNNLPLSGIPLLTSFSFHLPANYLQWTLKAIIIQLAESLLLPQLSPTNVTLPISPAFSHKNTNAEYNALNVFNSFLTIEHSNLKTYWIILFVSSVKHAYVDTSFGHVDHSSQWLWDEGCPGWLNTILNTMPYLSCFNIFKCFLHGEWSQLLLIFF